MTPSFKDVLQKLDRLSVVKIAATPNFFSIGGGGYLESPTSDLLVMFMGGEKGTPRWLAKALLTCLKLQGRVDQRMIDDIDWEKVVARREASTSDGDINTPKRIDLVIGGENFVLGVEHKVCASTDNNLFDIYHRSLVEEASGGLVLQCVLRPDFNHRGVVPDDWPVVWYNDLINIALTQFWTEVATTPISKWHFFYTEFLLHLRSLANPTITTKMNKETLDFAMNNFGQLLKAEMTLQVLRDELQLRGLEMIQRELNTHGLNPKVEKGVSTWEGNEKVLRYFPEVWGHRSSQVCLVYYPSDDDANKGAIVFYVQAYVDRSTIVCVPENLREKFIRETNQGTYSWCFGDEDSSDIAWDEGKLIGFSAWPKEKTEGGAIKALCDLMMWLQHNAFETSPSNIQDITAEVK